MTDKQHGSNRRVLVVEDWAPIAREVKHQLERIGCAVVGPTPRLRRGLELAASEPLDAAVLDVDLDGERVYPLAHKLRERGIPFVFMTGFSIDDLPDDLSDVTIFEKPVDYPGLLRTLAGFWAAPGGG